LGTAHTGTIPIHVCRPRTMGRVLHLRAAAGRSPAVRLRLLPRPTGTPLSYELSSYHQHIIIRITSTAAHTVITRTGGTGQRRQAAITARWPRRTGTNTTVPRQQRPGSQLRRLQPLLAGIKRLRRGADDASGYWLVHLQHAVTLTWSLCSTCAVISPTCYTRSSRTPFQRGRPSGIG
jgi:hypothetical protein